MVSGHGTGGWVSKTGTCVSPVTALPHLPQLTGILTVHMCDYSIFIFSTAEEKHAEACRNSQRSCSPREKVTGSCQAPACLPLAVIVLTTSAKALPTPGFWGCSVFQENREKSQKIVAKEWGKLMIATSQKLPQPAQRNQENQEGSVATLPTHCCYRSHPCMPSEGEINESYHVAGKYPRVV